MADPRLTPERIAEVRARAENGAANGYEQAKTILALIDEREALLAPRQEPRTVIVHPQMWQQTQERLADLTAENERLRALTDEVGTQMLALDEIAVRAGDVQILIHHNGGTFAVPPDSVEGIVEHVRKEARKIKGWSMYQRALDYDRHKGENERLRAVAEAAEAYAHGREMLQPLLDAIDARKAART